MSLSPEEELLRRSAWETELAATLARKTSHRGLLVFLWTNKGHRSMTTHADTFGEALELLRCHADSYENWRIENNSEDQPPYRDPDKVRWP